MYNFDEVNIELLRKRAPQKWGKTEGDVISLSAADMDFPVAEEIKEAVRKSIEIYEFFLNTRILRIFFCEIRLAVRLATQPPSNSRRAFAISNSSVTTGIPLAWIDITGVFTI